jgi:hypothetical protein
MRYQAYNFDYSAHPATVRRSLAKAGNLLKDERPEVSMHYTNCPHIRQAPAYSSLVSKIVIFLFIHHVTDVYFTGANHCKHAVGDYMNRMAYILLTTFILYSTKVAPFNLECVHISIQSAVIESTSLEEYQTAWQDITTMYLESHTDLAPIIEHALQVAHEQKKTLEQSVTDADASFSRDKQMIACGAGKVALGAYLALGLVVLPLSFYGHTQSQTLMTACFPVPTGIKKMLGFFVTHRPHIDLSIETIDRIDFGFTCAQWVASLVIAPYLLRKGMAKINAGLTYTDRLKSRIATLELILEYMQELQSNTFGTD